MNARYPKGPLRADEAVVFLDRKDREYLARLDQRRAIAIRGGKIAVDDVIGREEGSVVRSSLNEPFLVFRPSLPQLIPNLPRSAQVIYPKDIGPILLWADLFPGARVVEAGVGAGALSMALLRAIGDEGELISYEIREDFAELAQKNVARYFGPAPNWTVKLGDVASATCRSDDRPRHPRSARAMAGHRTGLGRAQAGRRLALLSAHGAASEKSGRRVARRQTLRVHRDVGKLDALLALQRHERPSAAPHGRAHRLSHFRAALGRRRKRHCPSPVIRLRRLLTDSPFAATTRRFRYGGRTTLWESPWRTG